MQEIAYYRQFTVKKSQCRSAIVVITHMKLHTPAVPSSRPEQSATSTIQAAIDAGAAAGGGVLRLPPGEHHCGTLHLRSWVLQELSAGCRLLGVLDPEAYHDCRQARSLESAALLPCSDPGPAGTRCRYHLCGLHRRSGYRSPGDLSLEKGPPRPKLIWFDDGAAVQTRLVAVC